MTDYTITTLNLFDKNLTELPEDILLYTRLQTLYIGKNRLKEIGILPPTLKHLNCADNYLPHIRCLPPGLEELNCNLNPGIVLDTLPYTLKDVSCSGCQLNSLDVSYLPNLEILDCSINRLQKIKIQPSLKELYCECNLLPSVDVSHADLILLSCKNNKISCLNVSSQHNMLELYCDEVSLTSFDCIPPNLQILNMKHKT